MTAVNPSVVLRNYMAESVIAAATAGDYAVVGAMEALLSQPFKDSDASAAFAALTAEPSSER